MALRGLRFLCFYDPKAGLKPAFYGQKFFQKERHILHIFFRPFPRGQIRESQPIRKVFYMSDFRRKSVLYFLFECSCVLWTAVHRLLERPFIGCLDGRP